MKALLEYFAGSPEATAMLLLAAFGAIATLIRFTQKPKVVLRELDHTGLITIDPAIEKQVKVTYDHDGEIVETTSLRQIDYDIYNSSLREELFDREIVLKLPTTAKDARGWEEGWPSNVEVLSVTAANSDGLTPETGGTQLQIEVVQTPYKSAFADRVSRLNGSALTYPALRIRIPLLERVTESRRPLLRIVYSGVPVYPQVEKAKYETARLYDIWNKVTKILLPLLAFVAFLWFGIVIIEPTSTAISPIIGRLILLSLAISAATVVLLIQHALAMAFPALGKLRPINKLFAPRPLTPEEMEEIQYYDALELPPHLRF